jgi:hypothetical protein
LNDPKVLNISVHDWANFAYDNMQSLRAAGINCRSLVLNKHPFDYEHTSLCVTEKQMREAISYADVIQVFHTPVQFAHMLQHCGKPVVVYHTGTTYRQSPELCHATFAFADLIVCALPELYLDAKMRGANPVYIVGGVECPGEVSFHTPNLLRIAHHPSNPAVKGTETLRPLFDLLAAGKQCETRITVDRVAYKRQLQRLEECDVYVEMMAPEQTGRKYGSFGITALEAAARGKLVITNCEQDACVYTTHYGTAPFYFCNTMEELHMQLDMLIMVHSQTPTLTIKAKKQARELMLQNHSHAATGQYIKKNVLERIFKTAGAV